MGMSYTFNLVGRRLRKHALLLGNPIEETFRETRVDFRQIQPQNLPTVHQGVWT